MVFTDFFKLKTIAFVKFWYGYFELGNSRLIHGSEVRDRHSLFSEARIATTAVSQKLTAQDMATALSNAVIGH
jgi:hypothetical protein